MKLPSSLQWLVPLIAALAAITSGVGLFTQGGDGPRLFTTLAGQSIEIYGRGLYANDSTFVAALFRGTDAITLLVAVPLLLGSYAFYRRGSWRGGLLLIAMLTYCLYAGVTYTFSAIFNSMFLLYVALFSAGLFGTIAAFHAVDAPALADRVMTGAPRRGMAIFLFVAGLGTLMLWLSELIGPLLNGTAPANLGPYTTMFTHAFDSAVITPACVMAGVQLLQKKPSGYLFAAPLLVLCTLIGLTVIAQTTSQTLAGIVFPIGVYIGMIGSWVVMGSFAAGLALRFFSHLSENVQ